MALMRTMSACVAVAERAGAVLRDIMASGNLGVIDKGGINNLQTLADKKAQVLIVSSLMRQHPKCTIIGEEDDVRYDTEEAERLVTLETSSEVLKHPCPEKYRDLLEEDLVIWVDPLDGTKEYTEGRKQDVTVLIGVAAKTGEAIGGVIYQPWYPVDGVEVGRTLWGVVGLGAFGFDRQPAPPGRRIITTTRSHMQKSVQDAIDECKPDKLIQIGGAGAKAILVIEGLADAYLFASPGTKKWDTCAPEAIIKALGGTLTDVFGGPITYQADVDHPNRKGVLAAMTDFEFYKSKIPSNIMER